MRRTRSTLTILALSLAAAGGLLARVVTAASAPPAARAAIDRGAYLVTVGGCHDCHTPHKPGPRGVEPDTTRALSGHPADLAMPAAPGLAAGPWVWIAAGTNTAFAGPWGVSFTANLTPDPETGLGKWTEQMFIDTLRTGRHQGRGRQILPPMPWFNYGKMTDDDLKAVFAYLQSLPPVRNRVPSPIDPPEPQGR